MQQHLLWYRAPAFEWTEALPLGNGRLGAMVFGGILRDELQLNEETLWNGGPYSGVNPGAADALDQVRALIFEGRHGEAQALADERLMARPFVQCSYQPAGRLLIDHAHAAPATGYRRQLDLAKAMASTSYCCDGVRFARDAFVSAADGILALRITADRPGAIHTVLHYATEQPVDHMENSTAASVRISASGRNLPEAGVEGQLTWAFECRVTTDGVATADDRGRITVTGGTCLTVFVDIATSFRRFDDVSGAPRSQVRDRLDAAELKGWCALLADHVEEHRRLYGRFELDLGNSDAADQPTDQRIEHFADGADPTLAALYVHYARYLMISSSRPGTQPANLQGIWNRELRPPWGSKYTANINLQMNYWLPDPANLTECFEPLLCMVEDLAITGAEIARVHYRARGWVLHHNTDIWRAAGPVDGAQWGLWPTGGAWLCAQLWDHVCFAGYPRELIARVYPLLKGASAFFADVLVPLPGTGFVVTAPSLSPENHHPQGAAICAGPAMDSQLLRDLFDATRDAAQRLDLDLDLVRELNILRNRLPPDKIGSAGQLQEWLEDWDLDAPEIHHRHISHLYGAYPSLQIDNDRTPALANAARRSLDIRGDESTGWGIGWRLNLRARLDDGERAYELLKGLISPARSYPNLLDAHPPFQIDGNFGGAAGILEMLVRSDENNIRLLSALPQALASYGSVRGLRVRGGVTLDFQWKDGQVTHLQAHSTVHYKGLIFANGQIIAKGLSAGTNLLIRS